MQVTWVASQKVVSSTACCTSSVSPSAERIWAIWSVATLQIAHILSADGDTLEVQQAVLDTTFWLATHVTCITLGYATTYFAGLIGVLFIIRGVFTRSSTPELASTLT